MGGCSWHNGPNVYRQMYSFCLRVHCPTAALQSQDFIFFCEKKKEHHQRDRTEYNKTKRPQGPIKS